MKGLSKLIKYKKDAVGEIRDENIMSNKVILNSLKEEREQTKFFLIITGDVLIDWSGLKEKLEKFYKLDKEDISLLLNDVKEVCYGKLSEDLAYSDFKRVLKRDMYGELSVNLNEIILEFLEELSRYASIILVTNLKKYREVFLPAFRFIDKVFKPWEYNKYIDDKGFMDVLYGYVKYYRIYSPTTLVLSSNFTFIKSVYRRFSIQSFLKVRPYYYDYIGKYNNIKLALGESMSLDHIKDILKRDKVKQFIVER